MKVVKATFRGDIYKRLEVTATTKHEVRLGKKFERKTENYEVVLKVTNISTDGSGTYICTLREVTSFGRPSFWKLPVPLGDIVGTELQNYSKPVETYDESNSYYGMENPHLY